MNHTPVQTAVFADGKKAAVCFTVDDVSPLKKTDPYEGGGDLLEGGLGKLKWLLDRHPQLKATLFTTANWREIEARPTRKLLAKIPWLRDRMYLAKRLKRDSMRLDKHPEFVQFLNETGCFEIGLHGLHHCHKGPVIPVEFQNETRAHFDAVLREMLAIFKEAGLRHVPGLCPPGWNAPEPLLEAAIDNNIEFVASARDVLTPISPEAQTNMSGIKGLPLIYPAFISDKKLIHFPTNFQATSRAERAFEIIKHGGLLCIKAHIVDCGMFDSVKDVYMNYLDLLFSQIEKTYGDQICWTTVGQMNARIRAQL